MGVNGGGKLLLLRLIIYFLLIRDVGSVVSVLRFFNTVGLRKCLTCFLLSFAKYCSRKTTRKNVIEKN